MVRQCQCWWMWNQAEGILWRGGKACAIRWRVHRTIFTTQWKSWAEQILSTLFCIFISKYSSINTERRLRGQKCYFIWRNKRGVKDWQWSLYLSWSSFKHLCQERWKGRIGVARVTNGIKSIRPLGRTHWEASVGVPRKIGPEMLSKWAAWKNPMPWTGSSCHTFSGAEEVLSALIWPSGTFGKCDWDSVLAPTWLNATWMSEACVTLVCDTFFYTSAIFGPGQAANTMYQILTERVVHCAKEYIHSRSILLPFRSVCLYCEVRRRQKEATSV